MSAREIRAVTPERWADMVELFERRGPRGGHRNVPAYGCWCMFWRDRSLWDELGDFTPIGVNERLVRKVRDALDHDGFERVKIVASGGFTAERIRAFEEAGVPVDSYGVGSSLIRGENDFTGDVVLTDGRPTAKVGRQYRPNSRLELVA